MGNTNKSNVKILNTSANAVPIKIINKIQIENVDAYEIVMFNECEDMSEDHYVKFIKLSENQLPEKKVFDSIFQEYSKPKIIISINGWLKNIDFISKQEETEFKQTFMDLLISDRQWVIGTGVNIGIHKLISQAVQDCRFENNEKQINLIGILDFAKIADTQSVLPIKRNTGRSRDPKKMNLILDPHYNCLIFHHFNQVNLIEKEIEFQLKLEEYCLDLEAFFIQILWGGKRLALDWTIETLKKETYVVVIKGSGGMAEIICTLMELGEISNIQNSIDDIIGKVSDENMKRHFKELSDENMDHYKTHLQDIYSNFKHRILIYDIRNKTETLDKKIFEAIKSSLDNDLEKIILLSMSFKEESIKGTNIFQSSNFSTLTITQQRNILKAILKNNKPTLLELFLEKNISIDRFLEEKDLRELYEESIKSKLGCTKLLREQLSLNNASKSIRSFRERNIENEGVPRTFGRSRKKGSPVTNIEKENTTDEQENSQINIRTSKVRFADENEGKRRKSGNIKMRNLIHSSENNSNYIDSQQLFIWALLSGLHEIAMIIWKVGNDHVASALKGSIILNRMATHIIDLSQLSKKYSNESKFYRNMAIEIMTEAFNKDQLKANIMLVRSLERWDNMSCLQIAVNDNVKEFCNQNACLSYTKRTWKGEFSTRNAKDICQKNNEERKHFATKWKETIKKYYNAPIMKFINYLISYVIFLLLFMYVNLVEFKPLADYARIIDLWTEVYVYCYLLGFIIEEIRQVFSQDGNRNIPKLIAFRKTVRNYFNGSWNIYDCFLIFLFIISAILRFSLSRSNFNIVRCLYAVVLSMFCLRSMQFFFISRSIGPKVIMIKCMIIDIIFFLFIFVIFIISYGTLAQSLQHPNSQLSLSLINDVFYRPYFHVYGELTLNEYTNPSHCNTTNCIILDQTIISAFGLFLLLTTILLVNLLIAMFGHTFVKIQKDVENHFSILQLQLLQEFFNKLFFPPPFNILIYVFMIFYKIFPKKKNNRSGATILVENLRCDSVKLSEFEKSFVESTITKMKSEKQ